jgi:hypothetical protein
MLVREWERKSQRVMVMANGFAWNGRRALLADGFCQGIEVNA